MSNKSFLNLRWTDGALSPANIALMLFEKGNQNDLGMYNKVTKSKKCNLKEPNEVKDWNIWIINDGLAVETKWAAEFREQTI